MKLKSVYCILEIDLVQVRVRESAVHIHVLMHASDASNAQYVP